jgi:outer membrane lipoprotein SlyB
MNKKTSLILIASLATLALSGCSTDGNILEPEVEITFANEESQAVPEVIYMEPEEIAQASEIVMPLNSILTVGKAGVGNFLAWEVTSTDENIVKFVAGTIEGQVNVAPYLEAVSVGTAEVSGINTDTGESFKTKIIVQ